MTNPVRFSHLRAYGRSAAHGHHARTVEPEPTAAMELGEAVHALVFDNKVVTAYPGSVRRGKEYDAFVAANAGAVILGKNDYAKAQAMAAAVRECKLARPVLEGIYETTILFRWMGLECRATPDVRGGDFLTELKTSSSADPMKFLWHARRMHYHAQLRFQEYACNAQIREPINDHWIVCVESSEPYPVTVFHVEPDALDEGDRLLMLWGERLKSCEASKYWPGYTESVIPLVWPKEDELIFGDE